MRTIDLERIRKYGLNPADFEPKQVQERETVMDDAGNRYRLEIGADGRMHLVLVESYTGELFE